jgi:hypothetical protein
MVEMSTDIFDYTAFQPTRIIPMQGRWKATIQCWAYSTGKGADVDQKNAGDRERVVDLGHCADINEAMGKATLFRRGMETSPHVWQAPIIKLEVER